MSLITIFVISIIFLFVYKLITPSAKLKQFGDKIPGPKSYPIIGNSLVFLTSKTLLQLIADLNKTYGSVCRLWLGKSLFLLLSNPEDIEAFLSTTSRNLNKSDSYRFLDPWLGDTNLITSDADIWHIHRKLLTPSFHFKILENSVGIILRNVEILCAKLEKEVDRAEFSIESYIEKCSLDIICEMAMGTRLETQLSENTEYLESIKTVCSIIAKRFFYPWLQPMVLFNATKYGQLFHKGVRVMKAEGLKVITERKKTLENNDEIISNSKEGRKHLTFLDFLLLESNFSNAEIENEVQTFMFAGHDTTTAAISFCLYELSNNPNIQNELVKEIRDTFICKNGTPSYQDFLNMKYLDCVVKEAMRMYTTVPMFSRRVTEQVKLPSGYILPVGALVNFNVHYMHRSEKHFSCPNKFTPERFLSRDENRHPYAYIPFSAGPRNCIGQKFAMIEMKIAISKILLKFQILPTSKIEPRVLETGLVLRSLNGLPVRMKRRDLDSI